MQNFLAFRDSPIIPLRRSPREIETGERWRERGASGRLVGKFHKGTKINTTEKERELLDGLLGPRRCCLFATFCRINIPAVRTSPTVTAQYASFNFTQPASWIMAAPLSRTRARESERWGSIFAARGHSISFFLPWRKRRNAKHATHEHVLAEEEGCQLVFYPNINIYVIIIRPQ